MLSVATPSRVARSRKVVAATPARRMIFSPPFRRLPISSDHNDETPERCGKLWARVEDVSAKSALGALAIRFGRDCLAG